MAKDTRTDTEKFEDAVKEALTPNGEPVSERQVDSDIFVGRTEMSEPKVELVDAGHEVPEVVVSDLERRHPDPNVGVYIPPEGIGTLPIGNYLGGQRVEDVFADKAPETVEVSDEDRAKAASEGHVVAETRGEKSDDK